MADRANFTTPNDYWKLENYWHLSVKEMKSMLDDRGYYNKSIRDKSELQRCLRRTDLGLRSYKNYTNDELRELIRQRDIDITDISERKGQRCELIEALEKEDIRPRFHNFTRLPAELRNRVYEYYFADFKESLHAPKQPPITLICSLLRKETLPLFYATCTFDFNLMIPMNRVRGDRALKMSSETLMWLYTTGEDNIADITHLRIRICRETPFRLVHPRDVALDFELHPLQPGEAVRMRLSRAQMPWLDFARLKKNVINAMQAVTNRTGDSKLKKEHFFAVRRAIEVSAIP